MEDGDEVDATKRASFSHVGMSEERQSAEEMDEKRQQAMAYEYLCHLQEAKQWMEACIREELPATTELEEGLMNGVILGKLAHFFAADIVPIKKLYDIDQSRYQAKGLHFRHTDNINHWLRAMEKVGFPKIFYPETTDIYDRKNMPRVIYCIHALSLFLFKLGIAPQIQDLYGKVNFTEEEITAMRKALEKYGIQMPAFNKIGGILANELSEDDAALHAAIIAINDAIEKQVSADTLTALQNPAARMKQVQDHLADSYQEQLHTMKTAKDEKAAAQRSANMNVAEREEVNEADQDVYDRLLTQAEIQGNVNQVNLRAGVDKVNAALDAGDEMALIEALQAPGLGLAAIKKDNATWYLDELSRLRQEKGQETQPEPETSTESVPETPCISTCISFLLLDKDDIHKSVEQANSAADTRGRRDEAIKAINMAIDSGSTTELMSALKRADAQLPQVEDHGTQLYLAGLTNLKNKKDGEGLVYDELSGAVEVLSAISGINRAVEAGDNRVILTALTNPKARVTGVEEHLVDRYTEKLNKAKGAKTVPGSKAAMGTDYLNPADVQSCVDQVNQEVQEEHDRIEAIATINDAIEAGDAETTLAALQIPAAKLTDVEPQQAVHYQTILMQGKKAKAEETNDDSAVLWLEEIQEGVNTANRQAVGAEKLAVGIASINLAIDDADPAKTLEALKNQDVFLHRVLPECAEPYQASLEQAKATKLEQGGDAPGSSWVEHKTRQGHNYYFNLETMESSWLPPEGFSSSRTHLSREEIQAALNGVTNAHDRQEEFEAHEDDIIKLQAYTRGMLARRRYKERLDYFHQQLPAVVKIQSHYRGYQQRKKYQDRLGVLHGNPWAIVKIQAYAKMWRARRQYRQRLQYFHENVASVVKLQAFFRSNMARHDYHLLTHSDNPPLSVVRKFVHLLDPNDVDYNEELEVQKLRGQVVQDIRANQELENNLNLMDIKIGLLVKNRITLQDVITHGKKLKKRQQSTSGGTTMMHEKGGLKALHKDSRHKLEMYQNLFYLLQTNPVYLAKLIFEMPTGRTTKFMESVILSLYNYAANAREEYLLLKLFKTALQEEINNKVDKMMEIVTGNPMVIKMVVTFNRGTRGQSSLREIIQPLVLTIIKDKEMRINSNPIEVYKIWVNTMESKTGETSKLPYDVTTEQALQHPEVRERLEASIAQLRNVTDKFLNTITSSAEKIPYGMRFMAKVLKDSLHEKFPDATEAEVLKIVGNLLYYRYMNPAIVAPDGFDIIDVNAGVGLSPDQRRNLGSIAKLLQFAASNKIFDGENAHLSSLNDYVSQAHEKFKKFFAAACDVPVLEEKFNIDEYSDFTMLNKPVVYMSIKEICDTHKLLIDHQDALAPERQDPLHELLDDLGEAPKLEDLIGEIPLDEKDPNLELERDKLAKTEVSLTLTNKFEVPEGDDTDMKALYTRTKRLIVDVIRVQPGDNLTDILSTPTTLDQEDEHQRLVKKREAQDEKSQKKGGLSRSQSAHGDNKLPVEAMKRKVLRHLRALEGVGLVSSTDNYQVMINDIAKDIRNQRRYRIRRRQELLKLKETTKALESKSQFYEEQVNYYNQYIKTCLDNLAKKKRRSKFLQGGKEDKPKKAKPPLKYTGARLHEKGVILEIDGLPPNQFKNVLFEIQETEDAGKFEVSAKFMGVAMEKVDLNLQDLLQLQYEGVSVMNMFDKAKVNVNLLIFLLNRKFYGK
ncbi:ras GTPase-activating-like protein IQGAP1 isoform X4 [Branchiostoma lanceolatum]|uniref:ras GTPase-activating-like protein IQGAP1 isoform X4 n=1 Tax=Branchiostoma lanceolatum TaxID=7740 RepID=UPI00345451EF